MKKIGLLTALSVIILLAAGGIYLNSLLEKPVIYQGVTIDNIDVGNMSTEEAKNLLESKYEFKDITFSYNDKIWNYNLKDLGFAYDIEKSVNEAYSIARDSNFFKNAASFIKLRTSETENVPIYRNTNNEALKDIYVEIEENINQEAVNATININSSINITDDQKGYKVETEKLVNLTNKELEENDNPEIVIPVAEIDPDIDYELLSHINGVMGEFTTSFNSKISGRSHNIRLASSKVDDVLLMPSQEFSFNSATGKISLSTGYKNAPVIVKGELQEGVGGGVCQVSTTLYNSVLHSGLQVVSRRAHSIPSSYVPIGRDAAVAYGSLDFKFKNPYDFPVYLKAYVNGDKITTRVYGDTSRNIRKSYSSAVTENVPRQVKYINDPSIPSGKQVVDEEGRDGIRSVTYQNSNGETTVVSRDFYPPKAKVIKVGTGPAEQKPAPAPVTVPAAETIMPADISDTIFN